MDRQRLAACFRQDADLVLGVEGEGEGAGAELSFEQRWVEDGDGAEEGEGNAVGRVEQRQRHRDAFLEGVLAKLGNEALAENMEV